MSVRRLGRPERRTDGYDVFISYQSDNKEIARALKSTLSKLATPALKRPGIRCFLDEVSTTPGSKLWTETLERAIDGSEFLVLLLTPKAAASPWVNREVEAWTERKGTTDLILVLCELPPGVNEIDWEADNGTLPPALVGRYRDDDPPLFVDFRASVTKPEPNLSFTTGALAIAAAVRRSSPDQLDGADKAVRRTASRRRTAAAAMLVLLALGSASLAVLARSAEAKAEREKRDATRRAHLLSVEPNLFDAPDLAAASAVLARSMRLDDETTSALATVLASRAVAAIKATSGVITWLQPSPGLDRVAAGTDDGTVVIADVTTHSLVSTYNFGQPTLVNSVTWLDEGRIAILSDYEQLTVVAVADMNAVASAPTAAGTIAIEACDAEHIIGTDSAGVVTVYDSRDGSTLSGFEASKDRLVAASCSPDGTLVAVGGGAGRVMIWDWATATKKATTDQSADRIYSIDWSPNGAHVAVALGESRLDVLDATDLSTEEQFDTGDQGALRQLNAVRWAPDSSSLAIGTDSSVLTYDFENQVTTNVSDTTSGSTRSVGSLEAGAIVSGGTDGVLRFWAPFGGLTDAAAYVAPDGVLALAPGHATGSALVASGDQVVDVEVSSEGVAGAGPPRMTLPGDDLVTRIAVAPDGEHFITASTDGVLREFADDDPAEPTRTLDLQYVIYDAQFSPDGRSISVALGDGSVQVFAEADLTLQWSRTLHTDLAYRARWSPDGTAIVSVGRDGQTFLLDSKDGTALSPAIGRMSASISDVAWSADGATLALGAGDATVRIVDVASGAVIANLTGLDGLIESLAFSPSSHLIAAADAHGQLRAWNTSTWLPIMPVASRTSDDFPALALLWLDDQTLLVAVGVEVAKWNFSMDQWMGDVCDRLPSSLTTEVPTSDSRVLDALSACDSLGR